VLLSASHSTRVSTIANAINGPDLYVDVWIRFFSFVYF